MKLAALALLVIGCTSTRQLATLDDPRLRAPGHALGFVVHTTERWHERIDPRTRLRFQRSDGTWSALTSASELYVDREGAWIERTLPLAQTIDSVRIAGLGIDESAQISATSPDGGTFAVDADGAWVLSAEPATLGPWLADLELAIAQLDPEDEVSPCVTPYCTSVGPTLTGDEAKLYTLRVTHLGAPLGTWRLHSVASGWSPAIHGYALIDQLHAGRATRVGWRWGEIAKIEVENLSGAKTFAMVVASIATLPLDGGIAAHSDMPVDPPETWAPELADRIDVTAPPLFTLGARVRAIALPTVSLDTSMALHGDLITSGAIARVRFGQVFDIGGGVRSAETRDAMGWARSTTGVFQLDVSLPLDAGLRIAAPFGFEVGGGGAIATDLRFPWGVRYASASSRWFATLSPATPSYLRLHDQMGRWSLITSAEVGRTF